MRIMDFAIDRRPLITNSECSCGTDETVAETVRCGEEIADRQGVPGRVQVVPKYYEEGAADGELRRERLDFRPPLPSTVGVEYEFQQVVHRSSSPRSRRTRDLTCDRNSALASASLIARANVTAPSMVEKICSALARRRAGDPRPRPSTRICTRAWMRSW